VGAGGRGDGGTFDSPPITDGRGGEVADGEEVEGGRAEVAVKVGERGWVVEVTVEDVREAAQRGHLVYVFHPPPPSEEGTT